MLQCAGYEVCHSSDSSSAIDAFKAIRPDLVFMDITMPSQFGLHVLRTIRSLDPVARVVVITESSQADFGNIALASGACGCVLKPLTEERLAVAVQMTLRGQHSDQAGIAA